MTEPESLPQGVSVPEREPQPTETTPWGKYLNRIIFLLLIGFVILLPHSIKGARHLWMAAFIVWLVALLVERKRLFEQPLALPMLAYITLSGISTAISPDPYLSWGYMKVVCYVALLGTLVAQTLHRLSQVRTLVILLLLSATAAAGFTLWQYTYGIGVQVKAITPQTQLYRAGIRPDDIIVSVNRASVHTPTQLNEALRQASANSSLLHIDFLRGVPTRRHTTLVPVVDKEPGTQSLSLARATPVRAQGTLGHYNIFAEVLMLIGCLAWALLLSTQPQRRSIQLFYGVVFLALAATVFATQTRAAIAGLVVGCAIAMFLVARRRTLLWTVAILVVVAACATVWIRHTRGLNWIDANDPGTQYRLLMWEDGVRLAWQHPLFGVGMETVQNHWQEWNIRGFAEYHVYYNFHSDLVQIAAERGLFTLAAWLWFVVAYLIYLFHLAGKARRHNGFAAGTVVGILSGFIAYLLTSLVVSVLVDDSPVMMLFFCFGVAVAIERTLKRPDALDVK